MASTTLRKNTRKIQRMKMFLHFCPSARPRWIRGEERASQRCLSLPMTSCMAHARRQPLLPTSPFLHPHSTHTPASPLNQSILPIHPPRCLSRTLTNSSHLHRAPLPPPLIPTTQKTSRTDSNASAMPSQRRPCRLGARDGPFHRRRLE